MSVRDRLLDAAVESLKTQGIRRTTVAQVADSAGVSRAWLYRHFSDKAALIGAALIRFDEAFWLDAHQRIAKQPGIAAQVTEAVLIARSVELPLALQLAQQEPEAYALVVGSGIRDVVPGMASFWHEHLEAARAKGELRPDLDIERAAEHVLRTVLSLVTVPGDAVDPDDARSLSSYLEEFLVPSLT
ncbi:MAG: TetR/AcrR family transcriptional regulator [Mycobacteriales bacterium]